MYILVHGTDNEWAGGSENPTLFMEFPLSHDVRCPLGGQEPIPLRYWGAPVILKTRTAAALVANSLLKLSKIFTPRKLTLSHPYQF